MQINNTQTLKAAANQKSNDKNTNGIRQENAWPGLPIAKQPMLFHRVEQPTNHSATLSYQNARQSNLEH